MLRRKKQWHEFPGCWRLHKSGAVIDFRVCVICPFHGNGCLHRCPGYEYGTVLVRFQREKR